MALSPTLTCKAQPGREIAQGFECWIALAAYGGFRTWGTHFGVLYKDASICGYVTGAPSWGNAHVIAHCHTIMTVVTSHKSMTRASCSDQVPKLFYVAIRCYNEPARCQRGTFHTSAYTPDRMSLILSVSLLSGKTVSVEAELGTSVGELRQRAQTALAVGKGRLLDPSGRALDEVATVKESGLQTGDSLSFHIRRIQLQATSRAFAAILADGSVVTWGAAAYGGSSRAVRDQLKNVEQIKASDGAFAAILGDGSVVTWGQADDYGGDSRAVQGQLRNVREIQGSQRALAAILGDGSVVAWGDDDFGGNCASVQEQLADVRQIHGTEAAFAAIRADGSVVTWGYGDFGGDSTAVQDQLKNVQHIQGTEAAFAAILADGSVVTWGDAARGGDSSAVQDRLKKVQQIQSTLSAFAAILDDGSVVTWGSADSGGDSGAVQSQLRDVQQIRSSFFAFAAILSDGSVVTWGQSECGGDSSGLVVE